MIKGKRMYVPSVFVVELDVIRSEDGIDSLSEAMRRMVKDSRVGRKVRRGGSDVGLMTIRGGRGGGLF